MIDRSRNADYLRLLRGEALGRISQLELIARGVVEGFITGRHQSPYKGSSIEFAEHRQYVPGDDLRDLDWRVFGKSDRYYIKQYLEETNLRATILLDASGSMAFAGDASAKVDDQPVSKFEYARYMAAAITYLLVNQQDAVGLVMYDTAMRRYIPARSGAHHMRAVLQEMAANEPGNETKLAPIFHDIAERIHRRSLVILLSDLFDDENDLIEALQHFRYRKHEVIVLHVMADEELSFPFDRWSDFQDLEDRANHEELDPLTIRAEYLRRVRAFADRIETGCGQMEIEYVPMNTKVPFELALSSCIAARQKKSRKS
jgi:uncharacterized protein (DUF58 family)